MSTIAPPLTGLKWTLRHQMIAVATCAVLFAWSAPRLDDGGPEAGLALARFVLLTAPWVLGGLALAFDRRGPLREWVACGLLFCAFPSAILFLDLGAALTFLESGVCPRAAALAEIGRAHV